LGGERDDPPRDRAPVLRQQPRDQEEGDEAEGALQDEQGSPSRADLKRSLIVDIRRSDQISFSAKLTLGAK
jgi:hypothetical protein